MSSSSPALTKEQLAFQEIFVGTLIYIVVLGLFSDYTSVVYAKSFSTILYASAVLEILTFLAFKLKTAVVRWLKNREGIAYKIFMLLSVWLIMFLSKFVFIIALDLFFGTYIKVNGFFGILAVVICVTVIHKAAYLIFNNLGGE